MEKISRKKLLDYIVHDKAKPHFNRKTLSFEYPNGLIEKVKLNRHL